MTKNSDSGLRRPRRRHGRPSGPCRGVLGYLAVALVILIGASPSTGSVIGAAATAGPRLLDRLSFELYSSRNFPPLHDQLKTLSALGFQAVEFQADAVTDIPAMKAMLAEFGLASPIGHFDLGRMRNDLGGSETIARGFGMTAMVLAWLPVDERPRTRDGWTSFGQELERMALSSKQAGLELVWHNHDYEFSPLPDGSRPLELIFAAAPDLQWEPDIGWITRAGEDPLPWLRRYRERVRAVHVKDVALPGMADDEDGWADVGYGIVDWQRLLPFFASTDKAPLIIEHDQPRDYARFARRSRDTIANW